jgi:hypothetical protein
MCENCDRPLHRKTAHVIYNANTDRFEDICRFCIIENPSYGKKVS